MGGGSGHPDTHQSHAQPQRLEETGGDGGWGNLLGEVKAGLMAVFL